MHRITIVERNTYTPLFDKCWHWKSGNDAANSGYGSMTPNGTLKGNKVGTPLANSSANSTSSPNSSSSSATSPSSVSHLIALFSQFAVTLNGGPLLRVSFDRSDGNAPTTPTAANNAGNATGNNSTAAVVAAGTNSARMNKKRSGLSGVIRMPLTLHPNRSTRKRPFRDSGEADSLDMYCSANSSIVAAIFIVSQSFHLPPTETVTKIRDEFMAKFSDVLKNTNFSAIQNSSNSSSSSSSSSTSTPKDAKDGILNESFLSQFASFDSSVQSYYFSVTAPAAPDHNTTGIAANRLMDGFIKDGKQQQQQQQQQEHNGNIEEENEHDPVVGSRSDDGSQLLAIEKGMSMGEQEAAEAASEIQRKKDASKKSPPGSLMEQLSLSIERELIMQERENHRIQKQQQALLRNPSLGLPDEQKTVTSSGEQLISSPRRAAATDKPLSSRALPPASAKDVNSGGGSGAIHSREIQLTEHESSKSTSSDSSSSDKGKGEKDSGGDNLLESNGDLSSSQRMKKTSKGKR